MHGTGWVHWVVHAGQGVLVRAGRGGGRRDVAAWQRGGTQQADRAGRRCGSRGRATPWDLEAIRVPRRVDEEGTAVLRAAKG